MNRMKLVGAALTVVVVMASPALGADGDLKSVRTAFESAVSAPNSGDLDGFLNTVHEEALSFYSCGPTSGKQGREACANDWELFFNKSTNARFETKNEAYRVIGDTGVAYGEYALSVNYNSQGRQTVHEGRYTMTYTKVDGVWQIAMQHNTPMAEAPQPVRNLRSGDR